MCAEFSDHRDISIPAHPTVTQGNGTSFALFQHAPIATVLAENNGRVLEANPAALELLGYDLETLKKMRLHDLHSPSDNIVKDLPKILKEGAVRREVALLAKGGHVIAADLHGVVLGDGRLLGFFQDATVSKVAEQRLAESEKRFGELFHQIRDAVILYTISAEGPGKLLEVNDAACQLLGYSREELFGMSPMSIDAPESKTNVSEVVKKLLSGKAVIFEQTNLSKDGRRIPVEIHAQFFQYKGEPCVISVIRDITERKRAERELQETAARLETAVAAGQLGVYENDLLEGFVTGDPLALQMIGITQPGTRLTWAQFAERIHLDDREFLEEMKRSGERTGRVDGEYRVVWPDESIHWLHTVGRNLFDRSGKPVRRVGVVADVTEQKQAEAELQEARRLNQQIVDSAREGIIAYGPDLRYRVWSPFMEELTGFSSRDVLGRHPLDVFPFLEEVGVIETLAKCLAGEVLGTSFQFAFANGRGGWVSDVSGPLRDNTGAVVGVLATVRDITAQKQAEEERSRIEAQFIQAQKMEAVGMLAGGVAHDFNNLLTVIQIYSELVLDQLLPEDPLRPKVEEIQGASRRAATLTQQLLAFSRKQVLHPAVVDLNTVVENTVQMLRRLLPENIEFRLELERLLWLTEADPDQMTHVLINLAVNARDAMPEGGALTAATKNVTLSKDSPGVPATVPPGDYVMMTLHDTGIGIDPKIMDRIFDPFYTTKDKGKGTGLGLASVYGILRQSSGFVWAESSLGQGAKFVVCLPRTLKMAVLGPAPAQSVTATSPATLLVVDDNEAVRDAVAAFAESLGYRVLAGSPEHALELAQRHSDEIQLLITDVVMPGTSGMRLAQQVKGINPRIKVLFTSGHMNPDLGGPDVLGFEVHLLPKPFGRAELALEIKNALTG